MFMTTRGGGDDEKDLVPAAVREGGRCFFFYLREGVERTPGMAGPAGISKKIVASGTGLSPALVSLGGSTVTMP